MRIDNDSTCPAAACCSERVEQRPCWSKFHAATEAAGPIHAVNHLLSMSCAVSRHRDWRRVFPHDCPNNRQILPRQCVGDGEALEGHRGAREPPALRCASRLHSGGWAKQPEDFDRAELTLSAASREFGRKRPNPQDDVGLIVAARYLAAVGGDQGREGGDGNGAVD
jgi:hypothetical protein